MFMRRRVGDDRVGNTTVGDFVSPSLQHHRRYRGHRLDARYVDFCQLFDKGQNRVELAAKILELTLGHCDSRQMRNTADGFAID